MALIAGIDGGGTKTEAVILDTDSMEIVGHGISGPSNFHNVGLDRAVINIIDALIKAMEHAGHYVSLDAACISLAGLDTRFDREYIVEKIGRLNISKYLVIEHDAHEALMAGSLGEPGVSVIAGTGSIAYAWNGKERVIVGDHGWVLGDQGSGFWIGFNAVREAVKMLDGRREATGLEKVVLKYFNACDKEELSFKIYSRGFSVEWIAGLAPYVAREAEKGDEIAREIIIEAGREIGWATVTASIKTGMYSPKIYYTGGVFKSRLFEESFKQEIARNLPKAKVYRLKYKPVLGSLVIAAKKLEKKVPWEEIKGIEQLLMAT